MLQSKDKISLRQVLLMCIVLEFSPAVSLIPGYTARAAKQAAWISGILSIIPALLMTFILSVLICKKKYKEADIMDIIMDIMGNVFGRIIISAYFLWLMFLLAVYTRFFAERITSSIMPNTSIHIFIVSMLIIASIAIRSGITVLARMNEIITIIVIFSICILFLFGLPLIKIENITPIYFSDILPALSGSAVFWAFYGHLIVFFFFGSQINGKEKLIKLGIRKGIFLQVTNTLLIVFTIGTLGWSLTARVPRSYFAFVKLISVFGVVERLESVLVIIWILSDFIIISVFSYAVLRIIKYLFNLSDYKPLIIPFGTLVYFLTLLVASSEFELESFSEYNLYLGIFMEYAVPPFMIIVGKLRRKI
jgi:spore germination protein (amino acid permease)